MPYKSDYHPKLHGGRANSRARSVGYYTKNLAYSPVIPRIAHDRIIRASPAPQHNRNLYLTFLDDNASIPHWSSPIITYSHNIPLKSVIYNETPALEWDTQSIYNDAGSGVGALVPFNYGAPVPLYSYRNVPFRSVDELKQAADVRRKYVRQRNGLQPMSRIQAEIYRMSTYQEPLRNKKYGGGQSRLACVSYAGPRPISKRQLRYYAAEPLDNEYINFRNYYNTLRVAATLENLYKRPILYQPLYRSKKSVLRETDSDAPKKRQSKWESRALADTAYNEKPVERTRREVREPSEEKVETVVLPISRKSIIPREPSVEPEPEPEPEVIPEPEPEPEPVASVPDAVEESKLAAVPQKERTPSPEPEEVVEPVAGAEPALPAVEPEPEPVAEEAPAEEAPVEAVQEPVAVAEEAPVEPEAAAEEPVVEAVEEAPATEEPAVEAEPEPEPTPEEPIKASEESQENGHAVDAASPEPEPEPVNGEAEAETVASPPPPEEQSEPEAEPEIIETCTKAKDSDETPAAEAEEANEEKPAEPEANGNVANGDADEAEAEIEKAKSPEAKTETEEEEVTESEEEE